MANEANNGNDITYKAGADLSAAQFKAVKISAANTVALCGDGEKGIGLVQNIPDPAAAGAAVVVREGGRSKAVVDGSGTAIAAGDYLGSNGSGQLVKVSADHAWMFARAEEASTAAGDIIEVTVFPGSTISAA